MPFTGLSLDGQVALVTGSARGIGRALAIGLAEAGADVAVSDISENLSGADKTRDTIIGLGGKSESYELDVMDLGQIQSAIGQTVQDFGSLDILVNNAGVRRRKPALEVTEEDWDAVIDTNLKGVFFCSQAAARHMISRGAARIINIASQMAIVAAENRAAYCASKGGVANLTRALALEWIKHGITVNAIGPGPTTTPALMAAETRSADEVQADLMARMPLGRRLDPEELVVAAIYLASPSAGGTNGHLLIVDGGWTAL